MKVLLAGLKHVPNQFTRVLERYGVEWQHYHGGKANEFLTTRCDAAVIVTAQLSHQAFWDVKRAYKQAGKPFFVTANSFAAIQREFEERLKLKPLPDVPSRPLDNTPPTNTVMAQAIRQAIPGTVLIEDNESETQKVESKTYRRNSPEVLAKLNKVLRDCYEARMSVADTVKMIESEGLRRASGKPYTSADVATFHYHFRRRAAAKKEVRSVKPEIQVSTPNNALALIAKILASDSIPRPAKLKLIERVNSGEISSEFILQVLPTPGGVEITSQAFDSEKVKTIASLTDVQAIAILQVANRIQQVLDSKK